MHHFSQLFQISWNPEEKQLCIIYMKIIVSKINKLTRKTCVCVCVCVIPASEMCSVTKLLGGGFPTQVSEYYCLKLCRLLLYTHYQARPTLPIRLLVPGFLVDPTQLPDPPTPLTYPSTLTLSLPTTLSATLGLSIHLDIAWLPLVFRCLPVYYLSAYATTPYLLGIHERNPMLRGPLRGVLTKSPHMLKW